MSSHDIENMSFWSLILEPGKKYEKEVENGIQVTRAALDTSRSSDSDGIVQIILEFEGKEMTVGNLSVKHGIFQTTLDLAFKEGDKVAFSTSGAKVPVSLTGFAGLGDDDEMEDELDDLDEDCMESTMDDSDDEDIPELVSGTKKRKIEVADKFKRPSKSAKLSNGAPKGQTLNGESFMSEDDEDDDSYNPTGDLSSMSEELLGEEDELDSDDLDSDDEEGEEEEDSDEEEDEDSEEEQVEEKKSKSNGVMEEQKPKKKEAILSNGTPKQVKQVEAVKNANKDKKTPVKKSPTKEGKTELKTPKDKSPKENKLIKSLKAEDGTEKTPKSEKKKKQQLKEAGKVTPKQNEDSATPKKQMRGGGVVVEDVTVGSGEVAKKGSNVSMYYVGRLKSNNKIFDSLLSGPPLKFVLGRGEVIQGWDVGLIGMKVGGKRKLSIPAPMAYGKKGAPPDIPPQANLEFEVTMMGCR